MLFYHRNGVSPSQLRPDMVTEPPPATQDVIPRPMGGTATLVAVSGVIVPFLMGWSTLLAWGASGNEAILVGAAMVATRGNHGSSLVREGFLQARLS